MVDRVQPLKQESVAGGGTETDLFPTETDHNEDYLDARGVALQNDTSDDEAVLVSRDASDRLTFVDGENTSPIPLTDLLGGTVPPIVAFSGYDSSGGTNIVSGWTDVPLDSERKKTSDFTHTSPGAEVTINRDDSYIVAATLHAEISSGTSRSEAEMRVMLDTGSGYVLVPGTQLTIYNRTLAQGKGAVTKVFAIDLNDGDKLKIQGRRESGGSTIVLAAGSELVVTTTRGPQGPAGSGDDELVKVSSDDTAAGYLEDKVVGGRLINVTTLNPGADEDLQIAVGLHATNHESGGDDQLAHQSINGAGSNTHAQIDSHVASTANPHSVTAVQAGAAPSTHASQHEDGGGDEIDVADLSGRLADAQNADALQGRDVDAAAPADGQVLTWDDGASEWAPATPAGGVFGTDLSEDEDTTTRSTTTTGWDLAHRLTTGALAGGDYRVAFYYTWRHSAVSNDFKAQVLVDGTQVHLHQQEPKDQYSDQFAVASGFAHVTLTSGAKDIDLEFGSSVSSQTSYILVSRLEIWRVA